MFAVFPLVKKIRYVSNKYYHYRQHEDSVLLHYVRHPQERLQEHIKKTLWGQEQWRKTGIIVGHEADWANWALEHIFYEDVKKFDFIAVQLELRRFLAIFDAPVYSQGLEPRWVKHLENLRLIAQASLPALVVDFEDYRRRVRALEEAESVSAKAWTERELSLRTALSGIDSSFQRLTEKFQQENKGLLLRIEALKEENEQLRLR